MPALLSWGNFKIRGNVMKLSNVFTVALGLLLTSFSTAAENGPASISVTGDREVMTVELGSTTAEITQDSNAIIIRTPWFTMSDYTKVIALENLTRILLEHYQGVLNKPDDQASALEKGLSSQFLEGIKQARLDLPAIVAGLNAAQFSNEGSTGGTLEDTVPKGLVLVSGLKLPVKAGYFKGGSASLGLVATATCVHRIEKRPDLHAEIRTKESLQWAADMFCNDGTAIEEIAGKYLTEKYGEMATEQNETLPEDYKVVKTFLELKKQWILWPSINFGTKSKQGDDKSVSDVAKKTRVRPLTVGAIWGPLDDPSEFLGPHLGFSGQLSFLKTFGLNVKGGVVQSGDKTLFYLMPSPDVGYSGKWFDFSFAGSGIIPIFDLKALARSGGLAALAPEESTKTIIVNPETESSAQ
jgi:hypothetical protein